jgi:60 kDa SS-A/Ro ribonucleoprotein
MARFNVTPENPRKTVNHEGALAWSMTDDMSLYATTATSTLSGKFYEPASPTERVKGRRGRVSYGYDADKNSKKAEMDRVKKIIAMCDKCAPDFVANLAEYIRSDMYLRSVPMVMLVSLAQRGALKRQSVSRVVQRPDEIKELLAIWQAVTGRTALKKMPNALKKGISDCFNKFDAYGFRKYNHGGKGMVTFLDAMRLTHPSPKTEEQNVTFQAIKDGTLPPIETWETMISAAGPDADAKRKAWEHLIDQGAKGLPYMAALKNIRNVLQAGVSGDHIKKLVAELTDPNLIAKSKQFPFRWHSAYKMLREELQKMGSPYFKAVMDACEKAIVASVANIPGFDEIQDKRFLIACDTSGSMQDLFSTNSTVKRYEIALTLGLLLQQKLNFVTIGAFGENWKVYPPSPVVLSAVGTTVGKIGEVGHATNGYKVIKWARDTRTVYDYIVLFSDLQLWNSHSMGNDPETFKSEWEQYKRDVNRDARLVLFDLAGYGTTPVDAVRKDVFLIAGFSEKIFQVLPKLAEGQKFLQQFHRPV